MQLVVMSLLALALSVTPICAQESPKPNPTTAKHGGAAAFWLSALNQKALDYRIDAAMAVHSAEIERLLGYAGDGGVLVISDIFFQENDAGRTYFTANEHTYIVGISEKPEVAQLLAMDIKQISPQVPPGMQKDFAKSTAFWFRKDAGGRIVRDSQSLDMLLRKTSGLYSSELVKRSVVRSLRSKEISRIVDALSQKTHDAKLRAQLKALNDSRTQALSKLEEINEELKRQLELAERARSKLAFLDAMGTILDFAQLVAEVSRDMPQNVKNALDSQTTVDGLSSTLQEFETSASERVDEITVLRPGAEIDVERTESDTIRALNQDGVNIRLK